MQGPLHARLLPVRRRQLWLSVGKSAAAGLLVGSVVAALLGLTKAWPAWGGLSLLAASPFAGALLALLLRRPTWEGAAQAVDEHYQLKDRATSAMSFLSRPPVTVFQEVEISDTLRLLGRVEPAEVVPFRLSRRVAVAVVGVALALLVLFWPDGSRQASAGAVEAVPGIVEEAENIAEDLKDLEQVARQEGDEKLLKLVQALRQKVEEMKQPGVTLHEAMAKISEVQSAIAAHAAELNTQLVDEKLKSLGEAMAPAASLEAAAKALQQCDYEKAAQTLENAGEPRFDQREAKAVEDKMKRISREMRESGLRRLGEAAGRMSAGIRGEKKDYQEGARDLAKEVRQQERRKRINDLLAREQSRLSECKSRSRKAWLSWLEQRGKSGASDQSSSSSQASAGQGKEGEQKPGEKDAKGRGDRDGGAKGQRPRLVARSEEDKLPSQPGAGESGDREAQGGSAPQGTGKAKAPYRQRYQKFRREAEAALENETIPLGQRQAVRRYFDLIHPANLPEEFGGMKREEASPTRKP